MTPRKTGESYDQLAERWFGESFDQTNGISAHERALRFLDRPGHALDIGCGSSGRFFDLLRKRGFNLTGIDVSKRMIELARQRHPEVQLHCADATDWPFPRKYDFISAWDCLWHIPLADQERVLRRICANLTKGGVFLFSAGGLPEPDEHTNEIMGPTMYYATPGIPRILRTLEESGCLCRHLEFDQYPEKHVCIIAQAV